MPHLPYSIPSPYHVNVIKYDLSAANRWCSHNSLFIPRNTKKYLWKISLHEKCPYSEFFGSLFSRIWTEYADSISLYSVRIQEITDHKNFEYEQFFCRNLMVQLYYHRSLTKSIPNLLELLWVKWCVFSGFSSLFHTRSVRKLPKEFQQLPEKCPGWSVLSMDAEIYRLFFGKKTWQCF